MPDNTQILYLTRHDMDKAGPRPSEIVPLLDYCFTAKGQGKTILPPKHWIERSNSRFFSAMSSYIPELGYSGCKWQSGDPANSARALPYIQGLYILTEDEFGVPVAIMDAEWITGYRTAAASALAAQYFMKPGATSLAILGCGLQGRAHLDALHGVMPELRQVRAFDVRRDAAEAYARELAPKYNLKIDVTANAEDAVRNADVVISGGPILTPPQPTIQPDWLAKGVVGITIDYDSYWTPAAMQCMDLIVTDDRGQIDHLKEYGLFLGVPKIDGELSDVAVGRLRKRMNDHERILCFNLGIALEDVVTAVEIYKRAIAAGIGRMLPR
jgi:ornithine cyclodeaminase/alanine dehydrogenase-like protein (mu-crystallin family)